MAYAKASSIDSNLIPVIDITSLRNGTDPTGVAKSLHRASQEIGFIYINGHGVSRETIESARANALNFFRAPELDKAAVSVSTHHRGWLGPDRSKMEDDAKADLKESFIWGSEHKMDKEASDHYVRGDNKWPTFVPEMKESSNNYFNEINDVAWHLMRGFAIGLGLEEEFFLRNISQPLSRASYVYYPQQPEELGEDQFGVGPHSDFGLLTVLCQDSVGGLQVKNLKGNWVHAPPIEGSLVVNVGDLLSRWTDGVYRSTPHRVINQSGRDRLSLVLAFDPDPDTIIDARAIFGSNYVSKQEPISCGDYLTWRFKKAFS